MRYICLIYGDEQWHNWPAAEKQKAMAEYYKLNEDLRNSGQYVAGAPLEAVRTAKTVRVRNGKAETTDGPFAETKEQLGGFIMIDADNMDQALAIAARIPGARHGAIEVRGVIPT